MKQIPLTQGQFTLVDDEDFEWLNIFKWRIMNRKNGGYAVTKGSYAAIKGSLATNNPIKKTILMHRVITNCSQGMDVDHINHDTLDNQRHNLRICTHAENMQNQKVQSNRTNQFKGVCCLEKNNKWVAAICLKGKRMHLGCFGDEKDAAKAYDKKAKELFGEFACLNFPDQSASRYKP